MKRKIAGLVLGGFLASTTSHAAQGYMGLGYAMVNSSSANDSGYLLDMGVKFGEKFKNRFGMEYTLAQTDDWSSGIGNYIDFYYSLGYEVFDDVTLAGNIGYGFEEIGTMRSGSTTTAIYATGLSYGASLYYDISKHFSVALAYKKYDLEYELFGINASTTMDNTALKLFYNF